MAGLQPLPPTVLHSSSRLTHAQAHSILSTFLDKAENDAAYRPDSTLSERGPQSASTGSNPNLTLHHLKRILQGIEGKRIGGEDIGRFFGDGARAAGLSASIAPKRKFDGDGQEFTSSPPVGKQARREMVENQHPEDGDDGMGIGVAAEGDGWQDKDDYDLAQREGAAELLDDKKQPGMSIEQPTNEREAVNRVDVEIEGTGKKVDPRKQGTTVDRDLRKKAKKDRRKDEKKARQDARTEK